MGFTVVKRDDVGVTPLEAKAVVPLDSPLQTGKGKGKGKSIFKARAAAHEKSSGIRALIEFYDPSKKPQVKQRSDDWEERRKAKEVEMQRRFQEAQEKAMARCLYWRSIGTRSIANVPWKVVRQTMFAEGGSGGVLLVELANNEAVCLKPQGMMAVSEFLAARVASLLGVHVAECRVVSWTDQEFMDISSSVQSARTMVEGHETKVKSVITGSTGCGDRLNREFLGILEFVPGFGLMGIEAQRILSNPNPTLLTGLGQICALDVVLNNMDRMPLPLWQNDGNLSNVMVSANAIVGIDQQVNPIVEGPGLDRYLERVRALVEDITAGGEKVSATLKQAFVENCGSDMSEEHLAVIISSLHQKLQHIAELWRSGEIQQCLVDAKVDAVACFGNATTEVGQSRLELMCGFLSRSCAEIEIALRSAPLQNK